MIRLSMCVVALLSAVVPSRAQPVAPAEPANPPPAQSGARIEIDSTAMEFGDVWQGEAAKKSFTVKNVGTDALTIAVKSSCGCTVATKPKSPLAPGESDTFEIKYDTIKRKGKAQQTVTLNTNDPTRPAVRISVTGNVRPLYAAIPEAIMFSRLRSDTAATQSLKIVSRYEGPLNLKIKEGQDLGPFHVELKELQPGAEYELTATTKPPLDGETVRATVRLETGIERAPEVKVQVVGYIQPDVTVRPSMLHVSPLIITAREYPLKMTSRADQPVKVREVRTSVDTIKVEVLPPEPARDDSSWIEQVLRATIPPGNQLPPGDGFIEILTDSKDPRYQSFRVVLKTTEPPPVPAPVTDDEDGAQP